MTSEQTMAVFKAANEITARLFDHRPFLQGEIGYLIKQFEEKRSDKEISQLFSTLEVVTETKDSQLDHAQAVCQDGSDLDQLMVDANSLEEQCRSVLALEQVHLGKREEALRKRREERSEEMKQFIGKLQKQVEEIDASYSDKEKELKVFYTELEKKLRLCE